MLMVSSLLSFISLLSSSFSRIYSRFTHQPTRRQNRILWPAKLDLLEASETTPTFRISYKDAAGNLWYRLASSRNSAEEAAEDLAFSPCRDCGISTLVTLIERLPDNCWEAPLKQMPKDITILKTDPDLIEKITSLMRWDEIRRYTLIDHPDRIVYVDISRASA